jgi:hypothetical protein
MRILRNWMLTMAVVAAMAPFTNSAAREARQLRQSALADGCVTTAVSDGTQLRGKLAAGDCTADNGGFFDVISFAGKSGDVIEVTVRPLSASFRSPVLELIPAEGDASTPPSISGGKAATLSYQLASSGTWRIRISSAEFFCR